jgi:hypothetical protein
MAFLITDEFELALSVARKGSATDLKMGEGTLIGQEALDELVEIVQEWAKEKVPGVIVEISSVDGSD